MMESEIVILLNNKKLKFEKNNLSLEKIRNFIKKEYKIPDQSFIELFDENYSKEICFVRDLEKLIVQTDSFNACIRINFKVRQTKEIKFNPMKISSDNKNIKINEIKNNNIRISYKNNLNEEPETSEVKNSLREEMHRNNIEIEDNNINEEAKKYKCEQEEEIKSLEKELNELKRIHKDLENDDNNDIFLSDNLIEKLKKDIINEIISKIKDELNEKIKEINKNINQEESIKQYEKGINEEIERKGKIVYSKINAPIGEIMDKQSKIESKINNANKKIKEENLNQEKNQKQKNQNFKNVEKVENKYNMNNINTNLFNKGNNHYKNKNYKYQVHENRIDNEEDNINKPNNKINQNYNIHLYNKQNINLNDRNNKNDNNNNNENKNFFNNLKVEVPKQIKNDVIVVPKKNVGFWNKSDLNNVNLLEIFNNIFFKDQHQKVINEERINDKTKYIIHKLFINHLNEERNHISAYAKNFILNNVLPIFQQSNINKDLLELVKFNISEILEAVGLDKNLYSSRYSPIYIKRIKNRQRSVEAAKRFRQEFQIKKEDINDEALIKKLDENDNDIYQTFQGIYGK